MDNGYVRPFLVVSDQVSEPGGFLGSPLEGTRALVKSLAGTIEVACALAHAGRRLDLTGLDTQIGLVCARALDLDPAEGREIRQELIDMRSGVAALAALIGLPPPE